MTTTSESLNTALSSCIPGQRLNLEIKQAGSQLSIAINRTGDQKTNLEIVSYYEEIAEKLFEKLRSLNVPNVATVKFYGRPSGTKQLEWQSPSRSLSTNAVKPAVSTPKPLNGSSNGNTSPSQKPKSQFQTYLEQFSYYSNVISAASLIGLLLLFTLTTFAGQKTKAVEYEYKIESVSDLSFTETMNRRGSDGWDLVFARRAKDSGSDDFAYECIFKRVKP
jgi:hypothetical protein